MAQHYFSYDLDSHFYLVIGTMRLYQMLEWKQLYHACAHRTAWVRRRPSALITLHNSDGVLTRCLSIPFCSQEYLPHAIKHSWYHTIS